MKFITEYDLRAQFNEQPFTDYQMEEDTRLTPGARQFLSDRRINLFEDGSKMRFGIPAGSPKVQKTGRSPTTEADLPRKTVSSEEKVLAMAKLMNSIEILEAEFLVMTSEIISDNIEIAGQISKLGHEVGRIKSILSHEMEDSDICFEQCSGMNWENCCQDLGNCFELSDFYIQSANGKMLVQMNALRAKTRALRLCAAEVFRTAEDEKYLIAATEKLNQIINKISQLICKTAGVKECRRTQ